ncbi:HAD-IIA family hydrolase [Desertimonas flava]|uniref:HAD-IIA family hydrolase n=1 Tax=Desertimonas flava TaxID=2064846 RepID=UPI000E34B5A6|nr:HAD-IIA family hydrolase [Desertimonas flava]
MSVATGSPVHTVLCDLDGVVWLAGVPIPGSVEAIDKLRAAGRRVVFVTNSSAPTIAEHTAALAAVGIEASGDVISSATAAAALVSPGERVLVCGGAGVHEAVLSAGAVSIDGSDEAGAADGVDAVVVGLHRTFDYERLRIAVAALQRGARFIACNRDPLFPTPAGRVPGAGAIVAALAASAQREPEVAGKPHRAAAEAVAAHLGISLDDDAAFIRGLVMVGDQVSTDGLFAELLACRFALVRTGNTAPAAAIEMDAAFDGFDLSAVASAMLATGE